MQHNNHTSGFDDHASHTTTLTASACLARAHVFAPTVVA